MGKKIKFKNTSNKKNNIKWVITIIVWTFILSVLINSSSSVIMPSLTLNWAFVILVMLILVGIIFDIIGIAVATATDVSFHSMSAKNVKAASQAINLINNSEKVASFCNDVVGDIVGIISGSAAAIIVNRISVSNAETTVLSLLVTAIVASLTVGGKAFGKSLGMRRANAIVYKVALIIYYKDKLFRDKRKGVR